MIIEPVFYCVSRDNSNAFLNRTSTGFVYHDNVGDAFPIDEMRAIQEYLNLGPSDFVSSLTCEGDIK